MGNAIQECGQCGAFNSPYESHCTMCSTFLSAPGREKPVNRLPKIKLKSLIATLMLAAVAFSLYWVLKPQPKPHNISKFVGRGILYDHRPDEKLVYDVPVDVHKYEKWQDNRPFHTMLDLLIQAEVAYQVSQEEAQRHGPAETGPKEAGR